MNVDLKEDARGLCVLAALALDEEQVDAMEDETTLRATPNGRQNGWRTTATSCNPGSTLQATPGALGN